MNSIVLIPSICTLALALGKALDNTIKDPVKMDLSKWLLDPSLKSDYWFKSFTEFFDDFLGKEMFGRKRIVRSALISTLLVLVFLIIHYVVSINVSSGFLSVDSLLDSHLGQGKYLDFFIGIFIFNILGDFLSLQESRALIGYLKKSEPWQIPFILLLDIILTGFFFIAPAAFFHIILTLASGSTDFNLKFVVDIDFYHSWAPSVFTALFTSIWLYLYLLGSLLIKVLNSFIAGNARALRLLRIDTNPFYSISVVSCFWIILFGLILLWLI